MYDWFKHRMTWGIDEPEDKVLEFFADNEHLTPEHLAYADPEEFLTTDDSADIIDGTILPWIPVDIEVPHEDILNEALPLLYTSCFTQHRPDARGWMSLSIHGLSSVMTGTPEDYGFTQSEMELSDWTDIAKYCPRTVDWMRETMRYRRYSRVRFMALLPGGWIGNHRDREKTHGVGATNVAINNPDGCRLVMKGVGKLPYKPGTVFKLNTGYEHAVWNQSDEPRIHMIFDGDHGNYFNNKVLEGYRSYIKQLRGE